MPALAHVVSSADERQACQKNRILFASNGYSEWRRFRQEDLAACLFGMGNGAALMAAHERGTIGPQ